MYNYHIRTTNDKVSKSKRNFSEINEIDAIYNGSCETYEDPADYYVKGTVKAVKIA